MSEQSHVQRPSTQSGHEDASDGAAVDSEHRAAIDADVDAILDEIDAVLEENSEEFVKSFVQKGGQ